MVKLPLVCEMAQAAGVEIDTASRNASEVWLRPRPILVVDDNEDTVQSMATLLELSGNQVQCAQDGLAALEAIDRFGPQIVLLDIGLPKMNGYEVCRAIRNNRLIHQPVVIALTGWGHCDDSKQAGFDHHPAQVRIVPGLAGNRLSRERGQIEPSVISIQPLRQLPLRRLATRPGRDFDLCKVSSDYEQKARNAHADSSLSGGRKATQVFPILKHLLCAE